MEQQFLTDKRVERTGSNQKWMTALLVRRRQLTIILLVGKPRGSDALQGLGEESAPCQSCSNQSAYGMFQVYSCSFRCFKFSCLWPFFVCFFVLKFEASDFTIRLSKVYDLILICIQLSPEVNAKVSKKYKIS